MTNEELQAHIAAINGAMREGIIEESVDGDSFGPVSAHSVVLNVPIYKYRIKPPQPREVWIWPKDGKECCVDSSCTLHEAHEALTDQAASGGVLFREVLK